MTIHDFMVAKAQIWGSESHACGISYDPRTGRYHAETETDSRRLTEKNYIEILNDMFYDYCVENGSWMGVS